jgi:hypothetical protein
MNRTLVAFILVVLCIGLNAQWSTNPATPNQICTLTDTQVMPKTVITNAGFTWIAWMDNLTGTYYTYLQKLNILGVPEFANPLLVSDNTTDTWLTEWDLDCDAAGNAVLCFQDLRLGTNNVVIYKISPAGVFLWGEDGIMLSNDVSTTYSNMAPTVICLNDGRTVAAWQRMGTGNTIRLQSISAAGMLEWGQEGITLESATVGYTWPQMVASDDCCILLKYFEDTGPVWAPTRKILVQKYNALGMPQWITPTVVQGLGGLAAWNQLLSITSDGMNGMLICWHDDRFAENISYTYLQRILVNGTVTMPVNGVRVSTESGLHQFYPKVAYEPVQGLAYVFWNRLNEDQNMWSLAMQKLSLAGERLWNSDGIVFSPLDVYPTFPVTAFTMESGVVFVYGISPMANNDQLSYIESYGVNPEGSAIWGAAYGHIATTMTRKLHYDSDLFSNLWGVIAWEDGATNTAIRAMRLNYNGSLGTIAPTPYNLTAQLANTNDVVLHWEFPELMIMPIGFRVYRNGVFFHLVAGGSTVCDTIYNLGPGLWSFYVTAIYESNEESPPSNEATINITGLDGEVLPPAPFALTAYPNPFRYSVSFRAAGLKSDAPCHITIFNIKGQLIRSVKLAGKTELNWTWDGRDEHHAIAGPGVYLVQLANGRAVRTAKLLRY